MFFPPTSVREALKAEGFAPVPRRADEERPDYPRATIEAVADVRQFAPNVLYSLDWSTDLVNWQGWGLTALGTNGLMRFQVLVGTEPQAFFRRRAEN